MSVSSLIRSFSGGELSPYCDALTTSDKYPTGCRVLENFIPTVYGPVNRRPGLEMIGGANDDTQRVRLLPFVFSDTEKYVMEFGELYARFWDGSTGMAVPYGSLPSWAISTPYSVGDVVEYASISYKCLIDNVSSGSFAADLSAARWVPVSSQIVDTPYTVDDLREIQFVQINDLIYLTHPLYPPQKIARTLVLGSILFTSGEVAWLWPALLDENTDATAVISPSGTTGNISLVASGPTGPFNAGQVGGYFQLSYERTSSSVQITFAGNGATAALADLGGWSLNTYGTWAATLAVERSTDGGNTWTVIRSFVSNNDRNVTTTGEENRQSFLRLTVSNRSAGTINDFAVLELDDSRQAGIVKITAVTDAYNASATIVSDLSPNVGIVTQIVLTNGGSLVFPYTSAPAVTITGGGGTGATAVATTDGVFVTSVTVTNGGSGYTSAPTIGFTGGGGGTGATATAYVTPATITSDSVKSVNVVHGGLLYSSVPTVTISGGGGSGATVVALIGSGSVIGYIVTNPGSGYTSNPTVTVSGGGGIGATAQAFVGGSGTSFWSEGAWSNYRGFPRTITTHENRIFYGGTAFRPQSIWGTAIDDFENFKISILADAGLYFTFITRRTNPIQWMFSKDGSLQIGTLGSEGSIDSSDASAALSPSDIQWTDLTSYGSRHLPAIVLQDSLFFVQKAGRKIRIRRYDWNRRAYGAPDVTVFAEHVTSPAVVEYDSQQHPEGILWCVRDDGQLIGMTYDYDQQVTAWHRHITVGTFESVCVIPGDAGDEVWVATMRTINGATRRFIERFKPDWRETFDSEDKPNWFYLDCAKKIVNGSPSATVTGLDYLEGESISILADGATMEPRVVSGGSITLDAPASIVIVGLPYVSTLRPMKLNLDLQDGTSRARKARIAKITAQVLKSLGCSVSTDGIQFDDLLFRSTDDNMDDSPPVFTGENDLVAAGNYSDGGGDVWIRQTDPMPLTLVCLTPVWAPTSN